MTTFRPTASNTSAVDAPPHLLGAFLVTSLRRIILHPAWLITTGVFTAFAVTLAWLFTLVMTSDAGSVPAPDTLVVAQSAFSAWNTFLLGSTVAAAVAIGSEWAPGRHTTTFTQTPRRGSVVTGLLGASMIAGAASGLVGAPLMFGGMAQGVAWVAAHVELPQAPAVAVTVVACAASSALAALLGSGLALLLRSGLAAALVSVGIFLVLPPTLVLAELDLALLPTVQLSGLATVALGGQASWLVLIWPVVLAVSGTVRTVATDLPS